jgi:type III pantothenate kinase
MEAKSVSDLFKALLVDMGNTRIKYVLVNHAADLNNDKNCTVPEQLSDAINSSEQVLISSVANAAELSRLQTLCENLNKPYHIVKTAAETLGIKYAYREFTTLGVDRWLAILAAREITPLPVAVIDLGTANTCDVVVGREHIGGWISPGYSLMRDSLLNNTHQVFSDDNSPTILDIGKSTPECVNYGCLAAQTGFVLMAEHTLKQQYSEYVVLITGGGQNLLSITDNQHLQFYSNLVLRGLFRLI